MFKVNDENNKVSNMTALIFFSHLLQRAITGQKMFNKFLCFVALSMLNTSDYRRNHQMSLFKFNGINYG